MQQIFVRCDGAVMKSSLPDEVRLDACKIPTDKKLSMSRQCDTLAGDSLRSRGNSRSAGTTRYRWLSRIRPQGTQRIVSRKDQKATYRRIDR